MARSYAIVAVLALVAASLLVTPAAAANQYTIASTNLLIDQPVSGIYSGTFVTASGLNSTSNGALQLLGAAADQYITTLASGSPYANDGLACVANSTTNGALTAWALILWSAANGSPYYRNVTTTLNSGDVTTYGNQVAVKAGTPAGITALCMLTNQAFKTVFTEAITFSNFNTFTDTGFTAAEKQAWNAIQLALYSIAWQAQGSGATYTALTGVTDPNYSNAAALFTQITASPSSGNKLTRRRLLSVSDTYTITVFSNNPATQNTMAGTSISALTTAINAAAKNLNYSGFAATSGASSLSVSLLTLGAALLVLLFGF